MVKYYFEPLDSIFMALSDATRRAILTRLMKGDCTITELAEPFDMSLPAVSKHIRILENAGLLKREKKGRIFCCTLNAEPLEEASQWLTQYKAFWEQQFDALELYLKNKNEKGK